MRWSLTKVFLTGGTGMVGGELALVLADEGYDVYCLTRAASQELAQVRLDERLVKSKLFQGQSIKALQGDLHQPNFGLPDTTEKFDIIVHAAAETSFNKPESCQKTNVEGTQKIIEFGRKNDVQLLCYISTAGNVGAITHATLKEKDGCVPDNKHHNCYTYSKAVADKSVQDSGLPFLVIRPPIVLSASIDDRDFARQIFWFAPLIFKFGAIPVDPKSRWDVVPISFLTEYTVRLIKLKKRKYGVYNIASGANGNYSSSEWIEAIKNFGGYSDLKLIPPEQWDSETYKTYVPSELEKPFRALSYYFPFMTMDVVFCIERLEEEFGVVEVPKPESYLGLILDQVSEEEALAESAEP